MNRTYSFYLRTLCIVMLGSRFYVATAQNPDTASVYTLPTVDVRATRTAVNTRSVAPQQTLSRTQLQQLNALQLSDAVKHFAGVTVKDYGGVGGLKTVSIRSLGAAHTTVSYDGIAMSDAQSGQIDLGRFSLDNVERLTLTSGQNNDIFRSATQFAASGGLDIRTAPPDVSASKPTNVRATVRSGSWGLFNPSLRIEQRLGERWILSATGEWMRTDGRYPYTLHYGGATDSTSHEKRTNTAVNTYRAEAMLHGEFADGGNLQTTLSHYHTSRGLPSAVTYYYLTSAQHLWETHTFIQSRYTKAWGNRWTFRLSAKGSESYQRYLDPAYQGTSGKTDDRYRQREYYASATLLYRALPMLSFSVSSDGSLQTLTTTRSTAAAVSPQRYSWLTVAAAKYASEDLTAIASALVTVVDDDSELKNGKRNYNRLSPYGGLTWTPLATQALRLRAFAKRTFRLPTFNDLYYAKVGDSSLRPETATQYNIGVTYALDTPIGMLRALDLTIDAYHNRVTDKIMAIPTKNIFVWSTVNLGRTDIRGIDATLSATLALRRDIDLLLSGNYTYQRALDMTDAQSKTYNQQIAYTPRVSASGQATLLTPWVNLSYTCLHTGKRYALGQNLASNRMPSYTEHNLSAARTFALRRGSLTANVEYLNFLNAQYEVVRYFPMPSASFRAGITFTY
jgi:outer membrane cobalamin receptor